jgi:hypothetical protein
MRSIPLIALTETTARNGNGSVMPGRTSLEHQRAAADWALGRWSDFPVEARPRPWVLPAGVVRSEGGFNTGAAKLSFLHGAITATIPVPDAVLRLVRERRDQATGPTVPPPLVIDRLARSEADFLTDRGHVRFPAWGLEGDGIKGRIWVLDPDVVAAQWKPSEPAPIAPPRHGGYHRSFRSSLEADGRTLHFQFTGGAPQHVEYPGAVVMESDCAVAVIPIDHDIGPPGPRIALGHGREVVVRLRHELGARVVVNLDASPVVVTPTPTTGSYPSNDEPY